MVKPPAWETTLDSQRLENGDGTPLKPAFGLSGVFPAIPLTLYSPTLSPGFS
jgi:hypothetical protein